MRELSQQEIDSVHGGGGGTLEVSVGIGTSGPYAEVSYSVNVSNMFGSGSGGGMAPFSYFSMMGGYGPNAYQGGSYYHYFGSGW